MDLRGGHMCCSYGGSGEKTGNGGGDVYYIIINIIIFPLFILYRHLSSVW